MDASDANKDAASSRLLRNTHPCEDSMNSSPNRRQSFVVGSPSFSQAYDEATWSTSSNPKQKGSRAQGCDANGRCVVTRTKHLGPHALNPDLRHSTSSPSRKYTTSCTKTLDQNTGPCGDSTNTAVALVCSMMAEASLASMCSPCPTLQNSEHAPLSYSVSSNNDAVVDYAHPLYIFKKLFTLRR